MSCDAVKLSVEDLHLSFEFGQRPVLTGVDLTARRHRVTAIIGPSGCGKSSLLRAINGLIHEIEGVRVAGRLLLDGEEVLGINPVLLRRRVGLVMQKPVPFPRSVFENVAFGLRALGLRQRHRIEEGVERSLRQAGLWEEVKDNLRRSALSLSGGQQQRLCIARALAVEPEVLLLDEPCASLDPVSTARIEDLIEGIKAQCTVIIVTHDLHQAARVADDVAFLANGRVVEQGLAEEIFLAPKERRTAEYVLGRL